jgi:hypothetical protein
MVCMQISTILRERGGFSLLSLSALMLLREEIKKNVEKIRKKLSCIKTNLFYVSVNKISPAL